MRKKADLLESNVGFTTKITDTIKKKFQSVVHHHENVVKHNTTDWPQGHFFTTFWMFWMKF